MQKKKKDSMEMETLNMRACIQIDTELKRSAPVDCLCVRLFESFASSVNVLMHVSNQKKVISDSYPHLLLLCPSLQMGTARDERISLY